MKKFPFTNSSDKIVHLGPVTIWPGQTREVDPRDLPNAETAKAKPVDDNAPQLSELEKAAMAIVSKKVADVVMALPDLSDEMLVLVEQADAKNSRVGVIKALAEEKLVRSQCFAAVKEILVQDSSTIIETLEALELAELNTLEAAENAQAAPRAELLTAIAADRLRRADEEGGE